MTKRVEMNLLVLDYDQDPRFVGTKLWGADLGLVFTKMLTLNSNADCFNRDAWSDRSGKAQAALFGIPSAQSDIETCSL